MKTKTKLRRIQEWKCQAVIGQVRAAPDTIEQIVTSYIEAMRLLDRIVGTLDGKEWDSGTASSICQMLQDAGYEINDTGSEEP